MLQDTQTAPAEGPSGAPRRRPPAPDSDGGWAHWVEWGMRPALLADIHANLNDGSVEAR